MQILPLDGVIWVLGGWLGLGLLSLMVWNHTAWMGRAIFPASAALSLGLFVLTTISLKAPATIVHGDITGGFAQWQLRLDALSSWFLLVLALISAAVSWYSASYFQHREPTPAGLIGCWYHGFLVCMALVLLGNNTFSIMFAWEGMALTSYLLVVSNYRVQETRDAGLLYLVMSLVGGLVLLLGFQVHSSLSMPGLALGLALFGAMMKMGVVPMHVWLPEAHPAAPSPVSALMSGLMLKVALYVVLRWTISPSMMAIGSEAGIMVLAVGLITALFAVIHAAVQVDMKRLLAYSSMENIGIMLVSLGLCLIFRAYGHLALASLALTALLFHVLAHALFKSLLFLATGTVLHATGRRNLGYLGGLMRLMPWTAWLTLVGVLSAAGLPLFGGFVSEWVLLQALIFTPVLPNDFLTMLLPVLSAVVAMVTALAAYTMVKFYGIVFLGQAREEALAQARDAEYSERAAMLVLALGCLVPGLLPTWLWPQIQQVADQTLGLLRIPSVVPDGGVVFAPIGMHHSSFAPLIFLMILGAIWLSVFVVVRMWQHGRSHIGSVWDCGYPWQDHHMQDTAEGFGQPIRQIFSPFMEVELQIPQPADTQPTYAIRISDFTRSLIYEPIIQMCTRMIVLSRYAQGNLRYALFLTLLSVVSLLIWVFGGGRA